MRWLIGAEANTPIKKRNEGGHHHDKSEKGNHRERHSLYRGLQKNANRLYALFLSSNLYMLARAGRSLQKLEIA